MVVPSNDIWCRGNAITDRGLYLVLKVTFVKSGHNRICPSQHGNSHPQLGLSSLSCIPLDTPIVVAAGPSNDNWRRGNAITDRGLYLFFYVTFALNGQNMIFPPRYGIPHSGWARLPYPVGPGISRVVVVAPSNRIRGLCSAITDRGLYMVLKSDFHHKLPKQDLPTTVRDSTPQLGLPSLSREPWDPRGSGGRASE